MSQKNPVLNQERFHHVRQINRSGAGAVYEAFDGILQESVSLKQVVVSSNATQIGARTESWDAAFAAESKVLTEINHDSIFRVHYIFSEAGSYYLVTENLAGDNLRDLLKKGSDLFNLPNILKWSIELIDALAYLHSQPIPLIHGNIKPENIIIDASGKIRLLPFGILMLPNAGNHSLIADQTFDVANLHFSPLEQVWAKLDPASRKAILNNYDDASARLLEKPADIQTDIYGLGATLYHLLTKFLPLDSLERSIDILEGKKDRLPAPKALNPAIPASISDALLKAMQIKRENRFVSAVSMREFFQNALSEIQKPKVLRIAKHHEEDDLLELSSNAPLSLKPKNPSVAQTKGQDESEQKRQFDLIRKQLQEAEAQKLKAEQRALEAEKLLLAEKQQAENQTLKTPLNPIEESPEIVLENSKPTILADESDKISAVEEISLQKTAPVSEPNISTEEFPALFTDLPKDNRTFRRMAIAATILAVVGGAGWGVFSLTKTGASQANQMISTEEIKPENPVTNTQIPAPAPTVEVTNSPAIETVAETNNPASIEESPATQTASVDSQPIRNKAVAMPSQRAPKQTATPPKIASVPKKEVTVDDIINDN